MAALDKLTIASICLAAFTFVACAKDPANNTAGTPAVDTFNEAADPSTLGYFSLPKVDDPSLRNVADLPQAGYALTMIQSYTVSHPTKITAAFEQKLNNAGDPRVGDAIRFEPFRNGNDDKKDYRLAAQLNLPLALSIGGGSVTFGSVKEYWNQVFTTGKREWALNTKPNATATNPSIEETLIYPTKNKGVYSHAPMAAIKNTVYVTLESAKLYIYLKTQLKNETAYVRLEYTSDQQPPVIVDPAKPAPLTAPQPTVKIESTPLEHLTALLDETVKTLGLTFELETVHQGEGARSFFGSNASGPQTDSDERMQNELRQIRQLVALIANSGEIRALLAELKVEVIRIINPYTSKTQSGVLREETGRVLLLLELTMTESQILEALKNAKDAATKER